MDTTSVLAVLPFTRMSHTAQTSLRVVTGIVDEEPLLLLWQATMRAGNLSERTAIDWPAIIRRAARATGARPTQFTADALAMWLASYGKPKTRAAYHAALVGWHRWLHRTGRRLDDPMVHLSRPKLPRAVPRPASTSGIEELLASSIRGRTRTMVLLACFQGLRCHEIAKLRGEDVDVDDGTLRVAGKGAHVDVLPLHPRVAVIAATMPRREWWFPSPKYADRPISDRAVSRTISAAMRRADVRGTAHSLRHWYATFLLRHGADIREVQELLRHASLGSTQIYTKVDPERLRAAILRLPDVGGSGRDPDSAAVD